MHHAEDTYYKLFPNVRGLFAHGVSGETWSREFDGTPCKGTPAEQDELLSSLPAEGNSEFWFYATKAQAVLFTRSVSLDADKPCSSALSFNYDVERAYVADGFIHSISVDNANNMDAIASAPTTHSAGEYSGSFERIHSLLARPNPRKRDRRQGYDIIAGIRAECRGMRAWFGRVSVLPKPDQRKE